MLGFLGTVIGMIEAFDQIQAAGDMSPALVAGGIKVALITTVGGLIVAMILQVFYNYCVSKVEGIVNNMEDASVSMLDILVKYEQKTNKPWIVKNTQPCNNRNVRHYSSIVRAVYVRR